MNASALVVAAAQCFTLADDALRSGSQNDAIRARLEECFPNSMGCFEQTLWAASVFASKRQGVSLERALRGYPADFAPLVAEVYDSDKDETAFRRDWFIDCLQLP
jgi:hypothetical protein